VPYSIFRAPEGRDLFLFRDDVPQPPKHEAWNQGEVVEARLLLRIRRGVFVFATTAG